MSVIDIVLLVAALLFAVTGWRRGLVYGLLSLVGFLTGAAVGLWLAPQLVDSWADGLPKALGGVGRSSSSSRRSARCWWAWSDDACRARSPGVRWSSSTTSVGPLSRSSPCSWSSGSSRGSTPPGTPAHWPATSASRRSSVPSTR